MREPNEGDLTRFSGMDLFARLRQSFGELHASTVPGTDNTYVWMRMVLPWPKGMNEHEAVRSDEDLRAAAEFMRKGLDYAINGLRGEDKRLTIDFPIQHGPRDRPETVINLFFYPPNSDPTADPTAIKNFIEDNKLRIAERLRTFFSENSKQPNSPS